MTKIRRSSLWLNIWPGSDSKAETKVRPPFVTNIKTQAMNRIRAQSVVKIET